MWLVCTGTNNDSKLYCLHIGFMVSVAKKMHASPKKSQYWTSQTYFSTTLRRIRNYPSRGIVLLLRHEVLDLILGRAPTKKDECCILRVWTTNPFSVSLICTSPLPSSPSVQETIPTSTITENLNVWTLPSAPAAISACQPRSPERVSPASSWFFYVFSTFYHSFHCSSTQT